MQVSYFLYQLMQTMALMTTCQARMTSGQAEIKSWNPEPCPGIVKHSMPLMIPLIWHQQTTTKKTSHTTNMSYFLFLSMVTFAHYHIRMDFHKSYLRSEQAKAHISVSRHNAQIYQFYMKKRSDSYVLWFSYLETFLKIRMCVCLC